MADLSELQSAQTVKVAGANPLTGAETNFMDVDSSGQLKTALETQIAHGLARALKSLLIGGTDGSGLQRPILVDTDGRLVTSALTGFGADFSFGFVNTAALTLAVVRSTVYTEQTSNAQRSIVSSSASDAAAGTGARTVKIVYFDSTGAGPFEETITLNGTTAVNTVATNICFIEHIEVLTVGSGAVAAGTISLKAATGGGGATIWSIATGALQTFGAHHYVATGKTCNITGVSTGHNGTVVGSGAIYFLRSRSIGVANAAVRQVSDFVRLYGQSSTATRVYQSPIKVVGPAFLELTVTPESSSALVYRGAFDFFEP